MTNNLHSRKRNDSGHVADVYKKGSGLGGGPAGNLDYKRGSGQSPVSGGPGPKRSRGGGGIMMILAAAAFLLFGGGSLSSLLGGTPAETTPANTTNNTGGAGSISNLLGSFGSSTIQNVSYADTTTASVDTTVASGSRDKYTKLLGNGNDKVTILVYMCGTDLESNYGMATQDLNEMAYATHSDNVNIIVETGGTKRWRNSVMQSGTTQLWRVTDKALETLNKNFGRKSMTDPNTLAEFIQWGTKNYPANRYMLVFWDHGGGSVQGFGYDELYPNSTMTLDRVAQGLKAGGVKFDIIGFDACLMANLETAMAVEPYADYLLASEETEPGTGWYHTNWLTMLAKNSSVSSLEVGKQIIDDFCTKKQSGSTASDKNTLSIVDLAELSNTVPSKLTAFSKSITTSVKNDEYQSVADARSVTREFASSQRLDQIDLIHFCETLGTKEAKELSSALKSCVKYNRTRNVSNAYGVAIYFPYRNTRRVNTAVQIYDNIDFDDEYSGMIKSFATLQASGQAATNYTSNSIFDLLGGGAVSNDNSFGSLDLFSLLSGGAGGGTSSPSAGSAFDLSSLLGGSGAVDSSSLDLFSAFLGRAHIDSEDLVLTEKNGQKVLSLSDSDWEKVQSVKLNVWIDDGTGYIDLGLDSIFEFTEDNDLLITYDHKWLSINDHPISYYVLTNEYTSDSEYSITGYSPVMLNGEEAHLLIEFSDENPGGVVLGAEKVYADLNTDGKLLPINDGDEIMFICDFYDYDGNFSNRYQLGEILTVDGELKVADVTLGNRDLLFGYVLTDIYNSERLTPMVKG